MHVTTCDTVRERIIVLHDTYGLKFRKIAETDDFRPIPAGTLSTIYKTGRIPKKWHKRLGLPVMVPAPVCDTCGTVHLKKTCPNNGKAKRKGVSTRDFREALERLRPYVEVLPDTEIETDFERAVYELFQLAYKGKTRK